MELVFGGVFPASIGSVISVSHCAILGIGISIGKEKMVWEQK